ncbi:MAG TPA: hypothetical protein VGR71_04800 [Nitrospira sp.]|nr:hypothetical protein [Nitrospira sp.]
MAVENYGSVREFVAKMDAGDLGDDLISEVIRLTDEQRDELLYILIERETGKCRKLGQQ